MKKYLFGLVLCVLSVISVSAKSELKFGEVMTSAVDSVYHDGKSMVSTVYQDIKAGTSAIYPDVKTAVVEIASGIGIAAEHLYTVLVKNYVVAGVKELLVAVTGLILLIIGFSWFIKISKKVITYVAILPSLLMVFGLIFFISADYNTLLMGLINPEWGAINYILEYTKTLFG